MYLIDENRIVWPLRLRRKRSKARMADDYPFGDSERVELDGRVKNGKDSNGKETKKEKEGLEQNNENHKTKLNFPGIVAFFLLVTKSTWEGPGCR